MPINLNLFSTGIVSSILNQPKYDWYVDSVNGNDNYDGKTDLTPFSTIGKLETVLIAGKSVGLAKGSHWREQLDLPGNGCSVNAYGNGEKPILDASNLISAGSWVKTAGQTNVYEVNITPIWFGSGKDWLNVWENNVYLTRVASIAICDSTPGSYFPSAATGTITLYIHSSNSTNPGTNGKVYEYSHRQYGIYSYSYSNCRVIGVETRRNLHNDGSLKMGRSSTIVDCLCSYGGLHNLYYGDGSFLINVVAQNAYHTSSHTYFVANENSPTGLGIIHINCHAISDSYDALGTGFYGHRNTSGDFGLVQYIDCDYSNLIVGFDFVNAGSMLFENCNFIMPVVGGAVGIRTGSSVIHTIRNCDIIHNGGRIVGNNIADATIIIDGGLWTLGGAAANGGVVYGTLKYSLNVQNLTFAGGVNGSVLFYSSDAQTTYYARNNNYNIDVTRCYEIATALNLDSDYNNFYDDNTRNKVEGVDHMTIAAYKAATGQDSHSTINN